APACPAFAYPTLFRSPGVMVTETADGGLSVRIHGVSSFMSNNQPLCMVDDVPVDIAHGASLRSINPRDIASIEVVQDPAGTAMRSEEHTSELQSPDHI